MAGLSYRSAARIAAREMRSSRGKFFFVLLSVAIGVAALTGVRGFSASFRTTLLLRARSIMAADLSARTFQQLTPEELRSVDSIRATGVQTTTVIEMISMASSPASPDPVLVSIKAVDPALYPFYGSIDLAPSRTLPAALTPDTVAVGEDLLLRLNAHIGDSLKLGNHSFRIAAAIENEPDRLSSSFTIGPRVLLSRAALESTGLLAPGNRANERVLFKLAPTPSGQPVSDSTVAGLKAQLVAALPEAQVADYRESSPAITNGLDAATSLLSLMSLVALVLGAVGVAMAMRAHLQQRLDTIAIMKSLGARSSQVIKIYLLQTLFLGTLGGLLGVAGGIAVQLAFPFVLGKLINIPSDFHLQFRAVFTGLAAGILITLLFTLPPLLDIRNVRPILILRRAVEDSDDPFIHAALKKISKNIAQILASVLILIGLSAVAMTLSDSFQVGKYFSIGLVLVLLVLIATSASLLAVLKFFLNRTRLHLPSALRHGLANLYRPGNPSAALLAALGLGVMQIMTVYLVQKDAIKEMNISAAPNIPNVFLIDIADSEIAGVKTLLHAETSVAAEPELLPITTARIDSIDGVSAADLKLKNFPRRALRSVSLTWNDTAPVGTKIVDGQWWQPDETKSVVAISQGMATRLGVHVGSAITFIAQDKPIAATVSAITRSNGQHAYARADYTLNHAALKDFPIIWYGGVHVIPNQVPQFERALNRSYPTVTIINVAQVVESIRTVVVQIIYVVQFLSGFSIFAGIVILASSIAGTKYRRIREVVVLKTLGATRARIATIFSIEFAILGLVAGAVGILFANAIAWAIETRTPMNLTYKAEIPLNIAALLTAAALTVLTGWIASHRILGQKPLEVLREE
ncbi:MAG: FtsX-like permease family protein [Acidobacteriota bacterium]|nr:FtsX-like permease family protein [Acidobacteriota bacterium]